MGRENTVVATGGYMFQVAFKGTTQSITATDSAAKLSSAVGANTNLVRLATDFYAWVQIGDSTAAAKADSTSIPLYANDREAFGIEPGQYVSVIGDSGASGTFSIMEAAVRSVPG